MNNSDPLRLIQQLRTRLDNARRFLDVPGKEAELVHLRELAAAPDLWKDDVRARAITQKLARFGSVIDRVGGLTESLDDTEILLEIALEEGDVESEAELVEELGALSTVVDALERETLFFGEYDDRAAIVSVHAGAGGVDAQDWAEILLRMYVRYLERSPLDFVIDEIQSGDEAGIKSATITIRGDHAYGTFESERGTHRLVRISPFDSQARRHTSFAGVDVVPEIEIGEVEINQDDLRIDTYRSQGAGGQHVNTSDSAVRITHLPTGIVVACQNQRSQLQNRNRAMQILASRLAEHSRQLQLEEIEAVRGEKVEAGWGRQIRSYVMQPYQMVKDLRSNYEIGNVQGVLDGDLDGFIDAYLQWRREEHETSTIEVTVD
ncbi:MAG: peptide chain release factor 2 [Acidobacteria bacterium]|nr:peptide chain release factor 2 [Acidobacteriota bacterium]MCH8985143.1 peptide chain release factor 2 [Acidobacteriota bacterium]